MNGSGGSRTRGAAVAMLVLLIAAVQIVVISGLTGSIDEADAGVQRVLMVRARYAADGAAAIMIGQARRGFAVPQDGATWTIGSATARVVSTPAVPSSGETVIQADSDSARRVIRLTLP